MNSNKDIRFFDQNFDRYIREEYLADSFFCDFIVEHDPEEPSLLDIGGGTGTFAKAVLNSCPCARVTIIEPSSKTLDQIQDPRIETFLGILPDVVLPDRYRYVALMEVLHHLTGDTIGKSKDLFRKSLLSIRNQLDDESYFFLSELYYEGFICERLPRTLIFYVLKIQNKLGFKIPVSDFLLGLNICFYTRKELQDLLDEAGFKICDTHTEPYLNTIKKHLLLLKNWGRINYICRKKIHRCIEKS